MDNSHIPSFSFPPIFFLKFSGEMLNLPGTQEKTHYYNKKKKKERGRLLMKDSKGTASPYSYWDGTLGDAMADCVVLSVIFCTGIQ